MNWRRWLDDACWKQSIVLISWLCCVGRKFCMISCYVDCWRNCCGFLDKLLWSCTWQHFFIGKLRFCAPAFSIWIMNRFCECLSLQLVLLFVLHDEWWIYFLDHVSVMCWLLVCFLTKNWDEEIGIAAVEDWYVLKLYFLSWVWSSCCQN